MKPKEFYKIMEQFVEEDKYWRHLKVGDIIYSIDEMNFHKMRIDEINIDERKVNARYIGEVGIPYSVSIMSFLTEEEYKNINPVAS